MADNKDGHKDKIKPYVSRKDREKKKNQRLNKAKKEKVLMRVGKDQKTLEIIIPLEHKDLLEEIKPRIKELCKAKDVPVEFPVELEVKKKKGDDGLYKLIRNKSRVRFGNIEGVVVWINSGPEDDLNSQYQRNAVINKKRGMDSFVGFRTANGMVLEKRMSELEIVEEAV
jgi:hypothetical protein